jgi:hypothetical protein
VCSLFTYELRPVTANLPRRQERLQAAPTALFAIAISVLREICVSKMRTPPSFVRRDKALQQNYRRKHLEKRSSFTDGEVGTFA